MGINRRRFLQSGASIIAGSHYLLNSTQTFASANQQKEISGIYPSLTGDVSCDVVIIGAGFAGVSAARQLHDAGKKVILLEARNRLGGRTYTKKSYGDALIDVGGIWVGPTQPRVIELAKVHGTKLFATYNKGKSILDDHGKISQYEGTVPGLSVIGLADYVVIEHKLKSLLETVNLQQPWKTPNAKELDSQTLGHWIAGHSWSEIGKKLFTAALEQIFSADPIRISLLHALYVIKAAGGLGPLFDVEGGAQQYRFHQGTIELLMKMVGPFKQQVSLESPVRSIVQNANEVLVISDKLKVRAKKVIVAIPPTLAGRIDYSPLLSADRDHLTQSMPMGSVIKFFAYYDENFWRKKHLSGQIVSLEGPIFSTFDNSIPGQTQAILVGFLVGSHADTLRRLDFKARQNAVVDHLSKLFGKEARNFKHYEEHDWSHERWSRGCFLGYFPPGIWTGLGHALWKPEGHIHWAGTETARHWNGYIEGAIESAERASAEVLSAL